MFGNPFKAQGRFLSDPDRQAAFPLIPFAGPAQGRPIPPKRCISARSNPKPGSSAPPPFRPIVGGVQRASRRSAASRKISSRRSPWFITW